jgi:DNA-binding CsgD family transcriptional regulator
MIYCWVFGLVCQGNYAKVVPSPVHQLDVYTVNALHVTKKSLKNPCVPTLFIFSLLSLLPVWAWAQPVHTLTNATTARIENYSVLPGKQYDLHTVLSGTTLPFSINDSLRPQQAGSYWLKLSIANPFGEARSFTLQTLPNLNNTLYYFDANSDKWVSDKNGIITSSTRRLNRDALSGILRANRINTLYVYIDVSALPPGVPAFKPNLKLVQASYTSHQEMIIRITWITSLTVLLLFFLNNVYIWLSFKDKTVFYYLLAQLGGIIYITAYKQVFPALLPNPVFSIGLQANGILGWYDLNQLLLHSSIPVIMYSMVQFTRSYLHTWLAFPRLDAFLKYVLYAYLPVSVLFLIINANAFYTEQYAWFFENIFSGLLFGAIIYASILGYIRKLPAAPHFLLANIVSFGFALAIPLYHLVTDLNSMGNPLLKTLLPDLVIITQTFGFSLALVARTRSIQQSLAEKEMEASRLETDLKELDFKRQLLEKENQQIAADIQLEKNRNDHLQEKLAINQRELASSTLYIAQKNELLTSLKSQIRDWKKEYPGKGLPEIESALQNDLHLHADWNKFRIHFEQVHPNFFEELQAKHPTLTRNEQRLCAYFHINLSTKEIATLLNIDPASVRRAKTRLLKKMGGKEKPEEDEAN